MYKPNIKELIVLFVIGLGSFLALAAFVFTADAGPIIAAVSAISIVVAEYQDFARKSVRRCTGPRS
ncbi:MAG: hypothetical protein H0W36_11520 [Gemmatimonadetes bacterium]|nr:hypothetical protein [Gemmatimonadota bacterium]